MGITIAKKTGRLTNAVDKNAYKEHSMYVCGRIAADEQQPGKLKFKVTRDDICLRTNCNGTDYQKCIAERKAEVREYNDRADS